MRGRPTSGDPVWALRPPGCCSVSVSGVSWFLRCRSPVYEPSHRNAGFIRPQANPGRALPDESGVPHSCRFMLAMRDFGIVVTLQKGQGTAAIRPGSSGQHTFRPLVGPPQERHHPLGEFLSLGRCRAVVRLPLKLPRHSSLELRHHRLFASRPRQRRLRPFELYRHVPVWFHLILRQVHLDHRNGVEDVGSLIVRLRSR